MRNITSLLLLSLLFAACHRPMMQATLETSQPIEKAPLTYKVLNAPEGVKDECIKTTIEYAMGKNGFFKSPFEADLKIYYRYSIEEGLDKRDKKIQVLVVDSETNNCLWKGETVNLPKKLNNEKIVAYTYLLMQRFDWENENYDLFVKN